MIALDRVGRGGVSGVGPLISATNASPLSAVGGAQQEDVGEVGAVDRQRVAAVGGEPESKTLISEFGAAADQVDVVRVAAGAAVDRDDRR